MRAWRSSPYGAVAIYSSGDLRACSQRFLTAEWVQAVSRMGWKIIPLDVGLQAPCAYDEGLGAMSFSAAVAREQGVRAAEGAVAAAGALGLLPGSALYSDLEPFKYAIPDCTEAVQAYLEGWTEGLHAEGYLAGAYGDTSVARAQAANYDTDDDARLDAVWSARWDGVDQVEGWSDLSDERWAAHQRLKQFRGDHDEVHGGALLNIDSNIVDAPVATVAQSYKVPKLAVPRAQPDPFGLAGVPVAPGWTAQLVCRTETATGDWSKLTDGSYLPLEATPKASAEDLPICATPFQLVGEGRARSAPDADASVHSVLPSGSLTWATCETPGLTRGQPGYWQKTDDGGWVANPRTTNPLPYSDHPALPLC